MKKLLVMAGGTGGHIFPALSIAKELQNQGWEILWIGTQDRLEAKLVPEHNFNIKFINISGIRGKSFFKLLSMPTQILKATVQSLEIIKHFNPSAALAMGGYVCGPAGLACKLAGIPLIIHEQNSVAGLTNQILNTVSSETLEAFPNTFKNAITVGNPVRDDLFYLKSPEYRINKEEKLKILVLGGSQGAKILNDVIPKVTLALQNKVEILHQAGVKDASKLNAFYQQHNLGKAIDFISDIKEAYNWADLAICRSGAMTISELSAVGLGAILVPFLHKDQQQFYNAKFLSLARAGIILEEKNFNQNSLLEILQSLMHNRAMILEMANNAYQLANSSATKDIAQIIIQKAIKNV